MTVKFPLLPCPFCGCEAWLHEYGAIFAGAPGFRVECEGACHAMTCYWHTQDQAVTAWNQRSSNTERTIMPDQTSPTDPKPDLATRVNLFQALELPGQPRAMHMGTSYLVHDLWLEVVKLRQLLHDAPVLTPDEGDELFRSHPEAAKYLQHVKEWAPKAKAALVEFKPDPDRKGA